MFAELYRLYKYYWAPHPEPSKDDFAMKPDTTQKPTLESMNEFMLAEYKALVDSKGREIERGQSYINSFLTITSGAAAFLALMSQIASNSFYYVGVWIMFVLLLLGIVSFFRVIERDIRIRKYWRRMSRIRNYFVTNEPSIERYMPYSIYDDKPTYLHKGLERIGLRSVVSLINSAVGATLVYLIMPILWQTEIRIVIAAITFVVLIILHELYADKLGRAAESKEEVRFPSNDGQGNKTPR
jgi:hypothetical protein